MIKKQPTIQTNGQKMIRTDIEKIVRKYISQTGPYDRYTSFDYCYNYFHTTNDLNKDIEKSCLTLGFYLASWGMYRKSFLKDKSVKIFQKTIQYIAKQDKSVWKIDVDSYNKENIRKIIKIYNGIKKELIPNGKAHQTLVSKVLLGVFGFIPAFDTYFRNSFRKISEGRCSFSKVDKNSLNCIKEFYDSNRAIIDKLSKETFTTDFVNRQNLTTNYPKAKIIDMYGFMLEKRK
jgi:hypothetical protein